MEIMVRAYSGRRIPYVRRDVKERWTRSVLVFDTETTTDHTQRLLFGSYLYAEWNEGRLVTRLEGLFHADDLATFDPNGLRELRAYARKHRITLQSRAEFVEEFLWHATYRAGAMVVGFNLPFDLSRLAIGHGYARTRNRGGFSLKMWQRLDPQTGEAKENPFRPRIVIKHRNAKSAFVEFAGCKGLSKEQRTRGRFLDLHTLVHALTDKNLSLEHACKRLGVERGKGRARQHGVIDEDYISYNRQDVMATAGLLEAARLDFDRYPGELDPCKAWSTASIAKACLRALGITPPMQRFKNVPNAVHGWSMAAYYGGRAEVHIRRVPVPVVATDFLSMYPTVNSLLGLWKYIVARRVRVVDVTSDVQALLERTTLADCFDQTSWPAFAFLAEIVPQGDAVPVRARYDGRNKNIGLNLLDTTDAVWYAGPDLVASKLLTGRAPKVLRAIALKPTGTLVGLRPVEFAGGVVIDPIREDFFRRVIEVRKSLGLLGFSPDEQERLERALKIVANSGSYGVFAEMQPRKRTGADAFEVHGLTSFFSDASKSETPGEFAFPFFAAMTTAAARLMLVTLQRCVSDLGGTWAYCDTDSMAIVATQEGGLLDVVGEQVRVLSWSDVEAIRARFSSLNPYDSQVVPGSILQAEKENFDGGRQRQLTAFAISAKRYVLRA